MAAHLSSHWASLVSLATDSEAAAGQPPRLCKDEFGHVPHDFHLYAYSVFITYFQCYRVTGVGFQHSILLCSNVFIPLQIDARV
jgi:hypothetical protein